MWTIYTSMRAYAFPFYPRKITGASDRSTNGQVSTSTRDKEENTSERATGREGRKEKESLPSLLHIGKEFIVRCLAVTEECNRRNSSNGRYSILSSTASLVSKRTDLHCVFFLFHWEWTCSTERETEKPPPRVAISPENWLGCPLSWSY